MYDTVWKKFNEFFIKLDHKPWTWEDRITLFVGHLIDQNKQSQTVRSYISAIKGVLAEINVKIHNDDLLLSALTRACKLKNDKVKATLPIRKPMLQVLIKDVFDHLDDQPYLSHLYAALFATTYFGLFRIGELTSGSHPVKVNDVHIARNKNKFLFVLHTSKTHSEGSGPQSIKISSKKIAKGLWF